MNQFITKKEVKQIWAINPKKPPCDTTIWKWTRQGRIPKPVRIGLNNLYPRDQVIALRNKHLGTP